MIFQFCWRRRLSKHAKLIDLIAQMPRDSWQMQSGVSWNGYGNTLHTNHNSLHQIGLDWTDWPKIRVSVTYVGVQIILTRQDEKRLREIIDTIVADRIWSQLNKALETKHTEVFQK